MVVKIASSTENLMELHLEDEDFSVAEIVHHELLSDKRVVFAGVMPAHPLVKRIVLKIQTKKVKVPEVLTDGSQRAVQRSTEILNEARRALAERKPPGE